MNGKKDNKIQQYLYYNYVSQAVDVSWVSDIDVDFGQRFKYTPEKSAILLNNVVKCFLDRLKSGGNVIVPISGGWDSRILLGAVMEQVDISQIKTVSFGNPGQLDFDIGQKIADRFGIEHHACNLLDLELTWERLLASVEESPWTYTPDGYFNRTAISQVVSTDKDIVLSGFMGDPLTGGHMSSATAKSEAIEEFVNNQRRVKSIKLCHSEYEPQVALPKLPENTRIPYSDLLDFGVRQASCIAPIVTPQKHWQEWGGDMGRMQKSGASVFAPFIDTEWVVYWLNAPKYLKRRQKLYLDMMSYKFPDLASIPSKYSLGTSTKIGYVSAKIRRKVHLRANQWFPQSIKPYNAELNYIDYANAFRYRDDYKRILDRALAALKKGNITPWLNLDELKEQHMSFDRDHGLAFWVLIGLALNIEAEEND